MTKERAKLGSGRRPNLVGDVFGRLTVTALGPMKKTRQTWICACECGNETTASTSDLRYGSVQSCGCMLRGPTAANQVHGNASRANGPTPTYNSWRGMIERCTNPKQAHYARYGGRGVTVCERWTVFENFLSDMGERPPGLTLDRKNNDGNYEPGNCRWATNQEQRHNRRDSKKYAAANDNTPLIDGATNAA